MNEHRVQFGKALGTLAVACQVETEPKTIDVYFELLGDIPPERFDAACRKAANIKRETYGRLPAVGELRALAGDDPGQLAARAWEAVLTAIVSPGTGCTVNFDDGRINAAVRSVGGWVELGRCTDKELDWRRREFIDAFKGYMAAGVHPDLTGELVGHVGGQARQITTGLVDGPRALPEPDRTPAEVLRMVEGVGDA